MGSPSNGEQRLVNLAGVGKVEGMSRVGIGVADGLRVAIIEDVIMG